jgi:UDP-N-acetylmuramoyl-L-alanyl-D-glutamate--2,6-diaminopimelate ligase
VKLLGDLLESVVPSLGSPAKDVPIRGLAVDSRAVKPGDLFVAIRGIHQDGHDHAASVLRAGAAAILAERPLAVPVPVVLVGSTAASLSGIAARFFDHPSRFMDVVGVTGTNGKTTLTYLLENVWRLERISGGVMGTIDYRWANRVEKAPNTTPHALDVQRLLAAMREDGVKRVAMEVSSHALALGRVDDVHFSVGLFTNLTQDHLDFHKTMEEYFSAKALLFERLEKSARLVRRAILNRDDPWAPRFLEKIKTPLWTYGLDGDADFRAERLVLSADGCRFHAVTPLGNRDVSLTLVGRHNVYNALGAMAAAMALGTSLEDAVSGVEGLAGVPGRLERVTEHPAGCTEPSSFPFRVFVDYAHTDDALRNVLETVRPLTQGRVLVLFGCGGDRDKTKRPRMGEMAARLADHVIVTSDNPRSEDPAVIVQEVVAGVRRVPSRSFDVIVDRKEAIARSIEMAKEGDVLLLAGKGHETYQILKDHTVDFDEREIVRHFLRCRER